MLWTQVVIIRALICSLEQIINHIGPYYYYGS